MHIHYLEIVTPEVDATCTLYSTTHEITFGNGDPVLGGARTATLANGGTIGVRAPMHDQENPVTRSYALVDDIQRAVDVAAEAGALVALPPMELPGHGICAIVIQGGVELGFWQV